ncbi:DUF6020 family protein [Weissella confusa]
MNGLQKRILEIYRYSFLAFVLLTVSISTSFGLYAENVSGTLHLMKQHIFLVAAVFLATSVLLGVLIYILNIASSKFYVAPGKTILITAIIDWLFAKKLRLAILIALVWLPFMVIIFPGSAGFDIAMQAQEVIDNKVNVISHHIVAPSEVYPIADYLVKQGTGLLTNQHNFFLTLVYGGALKYSLIWTGSYVAGVAVLTMSQYLFTVFSLSYSLNIIGKKVKNSYVKLIALVGLLVSFVVPSSAMSLSKNPLFAAGLVLLLGTVVALYFNLENKNVVNATLLISTLTILISVKFGWIVLLAELFVGLLFKQVRKQFLTYILIPLMIFKISMSVLFSTGVVIKDDPIESKGIQIQQVALYLKEYPSDLTKTEREQLSKIFNLDGAAEVYNPSLTDPVKSSGYAPKNSYKYKTVKPADWKNFQKIWLEMGLRHPSVFVRAAMQKVYAYFSLNSLKNQFRDITVFNPNFELKKHNLDAANDDMYWREKIQRGLTMDFGPIGILNSAVFFVVLGLMFIAVINISFNWNSLLITIPFYIQILAMIVSPINGSVRYSLGFMYSLPLLLLIMFMEKSKDE